MEDRKEQLRVLLSASKGEIDKVLYALPKQTPMQVLEKYRLNFKVNEERDEATILQYKEVIANF